MSTEGNRYRIKIPDFYETKPGYVYMVRVGDYLKVGKTNVPEKRLLRYEEFPPFKFETLLLKQVDDCRFYERSLQYCLLEYQVKGEWFRIPDDWEKSLERSVDELFQYIQGEIQSKLLTDENLCKKK